MDEVGPTKIIGWSLKKNLKSLKRKEKFIFMPFMVGVGPTKNPKELYYIDLKN